MNQVYSSWRTFVDGAKPKSTPPAEHESTPPKETLRLNAGAARNTLSMPQGTIVANFQDGNDVDQASPTKRNAAPSGAIISSGPSEKGPHRGGTCQQGQPVPQAALTVNGVDTSTAIIPLAEEGKSGSNSEDASMFDSPLPEESKSGLEESQSSDPATCKQQLSDVTTDATSKATTSSRKRGPPKPMEETAKVAKKKPKM